MEIKIQDGSTFKTFEIKKFTALQSFLFINKIIALISNTKIGSENENDKLVIINAIKKITKADNCENEEKNTEVQKINVDEVFPIFINVLKNVFATANEDQKNEIYNILLKQCSYKNGVSLRQVSLAIDENDFLESPFTFFKLIKESAVFNYSFFLKDKMQ